MIQQIKEPPVPAGEVFDEKARLIGRYVYLQNEDQALLDDFCKSWINTYNHDNRFFITLDLETTGLKPHEGEILLVSISWDGKQSIIFCPHGFDLTVFKEMLETVPINNQNIKFDLKWLMYHYGVECKIFLDTMVGSQLGWAGSFPSLPMGTFGLGNIARQLLGGYELEKETRKEFIGMKREDGFSRRQIEYAVKDSLITHKLVYPIYKRLLNQGLWDIWEEIEKPLIEILVRSEIKGVTVDVKKVETLLAEKEKELSLIYDNIKNEIAKIPADKLPKFPKDAFNPGSSQQIVNLLAAIGIKVLNTEKATLQSVQAEQQNTLLGEIILWRKTKGVISKFLTKWLDEHINPNTNCIYTSFNTYGAETGRLSCKEPNMQQIPGDLRTMIIARPDHKILSMDYCYDDQTEVLTNEGWKLFSDLSRDELFYSLNPTTHCMELVKAIDYISQDYSGKMLQVKGQSVSLLTTPNHRHYVNDHWNKDGDSWKFLTSEEIMSSDSRISVKKNCYPIKGQDPSHIEISHKGISKIIPTKDYMFLLGYWIADGTARLGNITKIYDGNKQNLEYLKSRIDSFVKDIKITKNLTCYELQFSDSLITSLFRDYGNTWSKKFPENIWEFDSSILFHLYEGLMLGDGTTKRTGNQYTTVSKQLANDFQRLLIHLGLSGSISYIEREDREFPNGQISKVAPTYCISVNTYRNEPSLRIESEDGYRTNSYSWTQYEGKIYCITLERNHIIMVRRNGKQVWCGQSQYEFRAAAAITEEEYLMEAFIERQRLLPDIKVLASENGFIDPDAFVKEASKGKLTLTKSEEKLVHEFALTDIHRRNAALILNKDVSDVTSKERSVGKCVSLDSYIHTNKGIIKLRELLPKKLKKDTFYDVKGLKVLTDEGFKDAPQVYYNGKTEVVRITTHTGRQIITTPTHRFRSVDKKGNYIWLQAKRISVGTDIFLAGNTPTIKEKDATKEQEATAKLIGMYIRHGWIEDKVVYFNDTLDLQRLQSCVDSCEIRTKVRIYSQKKDAFHSIKDEKIVEFLSKFGTDTKILTSEWLNSPTKVFAILFNEILERKGIYSVPSTSFELHRQLQNRLISLGINSFLVRNTKHCITGKPTLTFSTLATKQIDALIEGKKLKNEKFPTMHASSHMVPKLYDSQIMGYESPLNEIEKATHEFLLKNNLIRDVISKVEKLSAVETGDVSVPENSTVVYEGFVTHNTLGYAVLYGAGPPRVQESLAAEGFYHSLTECSAFLGDFFAHLPKIKTFIDQTHAKVENPGFISTIMGRKRFFELPPKYLTRKYEQEKQAAFREATNFCFQGANADATKKAMVQMDAVFQKYPEYIRPIILLTVHDEIVIEVHDSIADEIAKIGMKIMVDTGMEAINFKCPIEISIQTGPTWSK